MMDGDSVPVTRAIAAFAAETSIEQLPTAYRREMQLLLLDQIGCAVAGTAVAKGRIAVELVTGLGGAAEATVLGAGHKSSVTNAAFANGELMNALDWDPIPHTLPCVFAGTLALAEQQRASGAELIIALAIGYEIASRLAEVLPGDLTPRPHGYGSSIFGAVAAAGRILALDAEAMQHALGIGGFAAPIPAMTRFEGVEPPIPMIKYISIGSLAQTAVTSALLAGLGYTDDPGILDGPEAFWRLFGGDEERWDVERLLSGLGHAWRAPEPWYKRQPCEVLIGVAASRLTDIIKRHGLSPEHIEHIHFASLPVLANSCHTTTRLVTHIDAQFSVPYALAVTAHGVPAGAAWQAERTMRDDRVQALMQRITVSIHPDAHSPDAMKRISSVGQIPCSLEVLAQGKRLTAERLEEPRMTEEEIVAKFVGAASQLPPQTIDGIVRRVLDLENVEDVSTILQPLSS